MKRFVERLEAVRVSNRLAIRILADADQATIDALTKANKFLGQNIFQLAKSKVALCTTLANVATAEAEVAWSGRPH